MGLLSKEAFTSEKLAQIIFSYFLLEVTTFIDYRISKKNNVNSLIFVNSHLGQKSPWTKVRLDNCPLDKNLLVPWNIVPWTIVATPRNSYWLGPWRHCTVPGLHPPIRDRADSARQKLRLPPLFRLISNLISGIGFPRSKGNKY